MAKQLNWLKVERTIRQKGLTIFSPQDLRHLLRGSETSIRFLLTRAHKRGEVIKLRRGLYALSDVLPSELEVANALLRPSYISFHYALAYHHIISEAVFEIASATTRTTRQFNTQGKRFLYRHINPAAFTGYRAERVRGRRTVLIAEPEKALVDSMYFASLGRMTLPERLELSSLDADQALAWARLYHRPVLTKKLERLL
jgi:predicted transcriptional regulator of viral defense system